MFNDIELKLTPASIRELVLAGKSSEAWNAAIPLCGSGDCIDGNLLMGSTRYNFAALSRKDDTTVFDLDNESYAIDKAGNVTKVNFRTEGARAIHSKLEDQLYADDEGMPEMPELDELYD